MRLAVCWPITYWSSNSLISCGVGRSDLAPVTDSMAEVSSRMMSLHRSMHSSQMKTDGPAISFFTSCWLLPQNEQYSNFSPLEDFLSDMGLFSLGYWLGRACRYSLAGGHVCSEEKLLTASMLPEIKTKRPNVSASGRFFSLTATDASSAVGQHFVDQTILCGLVGGQEAVAIRVFGDLLDRLARAFGHDAVQTMAQVQDFLGLDFDVRSHALRAAGRLVDHD